MEYIQHKIHCVAIQGDKILFGVQHGIHCIMIQYGTILRGTTWDTPCGDTG